MHYYQAILAAAHRDTTGTVQSAPLVMWDAIAAQVQQVRSAQPVYQMHLYSLIILAFATPNTIGADLLVLCAIVLARLAQEVWELSAPHAIRMQVL